MTEINSDDPLDKWNIFWLAITAITIVVLLVRLQFDTLHFNPGSLLILNIGIPFMLMLFQYRQLRKKKVFAIWTSIAVFLFLYFIWLRIDSLLILKSNESAALGLKSPLAFLVAYYIFRKISLKYYGTELIIPPRYGRYSSIEGRESNLMDFVAMVSYWIIVILTGLY
jgi:hypothetical protein